MNIDKLTEEELRIIIEEYIESMTDMEKMVMEIARDHLESSFCLEKSVGFINWYREKLKNMNTKDNSSK
jgi:hypothetical protein